MKATLPGPIGLLSFWLGLPVFAFLFWAWWDSMHHAAAMNWSHGTTTTMLWPPYLPPPVIRPLADIEVPPMQFSPFDPPAQDPGIGGMGFKPTYFRPSHFDDSPRSSYPTQMQPYRSIGSKAASLWISSWIAPKGSQGGCDYRVLKQEGNWFPMPEWPHTAVTRNTTLLIPYWLICGVYSAGWGLWIFWRIRRRKRLAPALQ